MPKKTNDPKLMLVPLDDIYPDPDQPRHFFDEGALQELTDSIREKGVLQPILLRRHPVRADGYMLVCGERRFRAAKAIEDIGTIPAIFRDISKEEALELQIIENLQRKDVHPMEEAAGFKSLLDHKQLTVDEIAARVAKSIFYVRQRMKLNSLIEGFQKAYFEGRMTAKTAITLSSLNEDAQAEIYEEKKNYDRIEIGDWELRNYRGVLTGVAFSLEDETLDKKVGACTNCVFNSATASLFPEDAENPICSNIKCLANKAAIHFERELVKAMEDPTTVFVDHSYRQDTEITSRLAKEGFSVLVSGYNQNAFRIKSKPKAPEPPEYDEYEDEDDREWNQKAYGEEIEEYKNDIKEYNEAVASGKYQKVFIINGEGKGTWAYGLMPNKTSAIGSTTATKAKEKAGKLTISDIDAEVERLEEREKRAKELDVEKVHTRILEAVDKDTTINEVPKTAAPKSVNRLLALFIFVELVGWQEQELIEEKLGISCVDDDPASLHDQLNKLTPQHLTFFLRQIIKDKYRGYSKLRNHGYMFRLMAESLGTIPIEAFEQEQQEKSEKRAAKVEKRILELMEKRAVLLTKKPKSKPKTSKKKK